MKPLNAVAFVLVLVPALASLQGKPKKPYKLPAMFNQARYVYVEAIDGQQFDPRLPPEDQQAIADMNGAIQKWSRYVLTVRRDEAELIFVVRKGRAAEARVGIQGGTSPQGAPGRPSGNPSGGIGVAVGGEVGPPDDLLEVYQENPDHTRGAMLWQRTLANGLNGPDVLLLQQLKDRVEHDYPVQTASQPHKP
jgi:hypothetical protein